MNKLFIIVLVIFIFLIFSNFNKTSNSKPSVSINNKTFYISVAKTEDQKTKGLSIYNTLPEDEGMLFIFPKPDYYTFWMKEMKFPIDIIFIQNYKIVDIFQNVPKPISKDQKLPIYKPREMSDYVLEINAGLSKKYNFHVGDSIKINL